MSFALEIKALKKQYANGVNALSGIDLQVPKGAFYALLGPNGAGKSTTIGIVSSLITASSGDVWVCGHHLQTARSAAKCAIGLVPQEFNFNVWENPLDIVTNQGRYYGVPRAQARARAGKLLRELDLEDKQYKPARTLSGGMKRRLMIARALVNQPELLILDEPTAGVDIEIRRHMWTFLQTLNRQGTTIILTTHYLEEAEALCERVAIINQGKIMVDGAVSTLLSQAMSEHFILDIDRPVEDIPTLAHGQLSLLSSQQLGLELPRGVALNDIFTQLSQAAIHVTSMRTRTNRLEEFFINQINQAKS